MSFLTETNILTLMAVRTLNYPVIISERVAVERSARSRVWQRAQKVLYPSATAAAAQTEVAAAWFRHLAPAVPVRVIANPVSVKEEMPDSTTAAVLARSRGRKIILAMGRFTYQKGFDLLLKAFSYVAADCSDWDLVIAGDGPDRTRLEAQIGTLDLRPRVSLPGFTQTPHALMRGVDLFVLSSRFEGLPNALMEAMANGVACASFDCPTGPAALIAHGMNGWLVPPEDPQALGNALRTLMADAALRQRLGGSARITMNRYSMNAILAEWDALFERIANGGRIVA